MAEDAEARMAKLERRQARNMRVAAARGFLRGVCAMLRPGDIVIDCGANVGEVTAPLAATGATVECYEPDPYAFERLTKRFSEAANIHLINAAAATSEGKVHLHRVADFEARPGGASVKSTILEGGRGVSDAGADAVEVRKIDFPARLRDLIAEHGEIAFLKMDIEGAELEILEVMEAEKLFAHIRCTVAETHERKFKALRPRFRALRGRIGAAWPEDRVNLDWI